MPADPNAPEPLRTALNDMEAQVQSFKQSLAFAPPEMFDEHYINLQMGLAATMTTLYETTAEKGD